MNFKVYSLPIFDKQTKKLVKKYPSLKSELNNLADSLEINAEQGKKLGNNFYKIRLAIQSKGKGKSGGARVITYIKLIDNKVFLTTIYDKSEKDSITDKELDEIFRLIPL